VRSLLLVLPVLLLTALVSDGVAFADKYRIAIPFGASDPGAPFFWSEDATGVTTGIITVNPGDSVEWQNTDTAFHTVTSVTAASFQSGEFVPDGVFDSGFFTAGKSHIQKFDKIGDYHYFCSIHPFMTGIVHVAERNSDNIRSIDGVGSDFVGDGMGLDVKYVLDTSLRHDVQINPDERTITFAISGDTLNDQIALVLPAELIENPNTVWVDGTMTDFTTEETSSGLKLTIPIEPHAKEIKIMGTYVIPEFGLFAAGILGAGLLSGMFLARFKLSVF